MAYGRRHGFQVADAVLSYRRRRPVPSGVEGRLRAGVSSGRARLHLLQAAGKSRDNRTVVGRVTQRAATPKGLACRQHGQERCLNVRVPRSAILRGRTSCGSAWTVGSDSLSAQPIVACAACPGTDCRTGADRGGGRAVPRCRVGLHGSRQGRAHRAGSGARGPVVEVPGATSLQEPGPSIGVSAMSACADRP